MSNASLSQKQLNEINNTIRYAMISVFRMAKPLDDTDRAALTDDLTTRLDGVSEDNDLIIRGFYDLAGMRGDADFMVWWHAEHIETLQRAYRALQCSDLGRHTEPVWSCPALHRPAEFNRGHVPDFLVDPHPKAYVCVYPFVRSYDWYLLDPNERRAILAEHGKAARDYPDVRANTVPAFALGDYEWLLAFEAEELARIVDLMRELRATEARRHVRVEIPFFTGPRVELSQLITTLP